MRFLLPVVSSVVLLLLGCTSTAPKTQTVHLVPEFEGLSDMQRELLELATFDFRLADEGQEPKYAKLKWALRDGGTKIYEGNGYSLISHNGRIAKQVDEDGRMAGATLTLQRRITRGERRTVSTERFLPNPKKRAEQAAT